MELIEDLLDEVRLLWHVAARAAERLHGKEQLTVGMRAVLERLSLHGPATVPQIARARCVTRQHVQGLVNALLELHLVALGSNPAHKRSALVRLTEEGQKTFERIHRRERRFLEHVVLHSQADEIRRTLQTLKAVRTALEAES